MDWWLFAGGVLGLCWLLFFLKRLPLRPPQGFHVIVVGAGPGGIAMGKRLNDMGIGFTILEKEMMVGGTWFKNSYPGCECDVFAHFYSFSFCLNLNWSKAYPGQAEILSYLNSVASKFGVLSNIRFNTKVLRSVWNEDTKAWTVETDTGEIFKGNIVVSAVGSLHKARLPDIPGLGDFSGTSFHTSEWRKGFVTKGKRIAVIGTGASAVQVVPALADQQPASLTVFQRSAVWTLPRGDYVYSARTKTIFAQIPLVGRIYRWFLFWRYELAFKTVFTKGKSADELKAAMKSHILNQVKDGKLAARLTPDYDIGCKRPTTSDDFLPTFNNEFVHLNTTPIERVTSRGIMTVDNSEHEFDAIVYATGFDVAKSINAFEQVVGGQEPAHEDTPKAFLGITKPHHPNFFMLFGPGTVQSSVIFMIECQVEYVIDGITKMMKLGAKSLSLKTSVLEKYDEYLQENNETTMFGRGSCTSYYKNAAGQNWVVWTKLMWEYWWQTRSFVLDHYIAKF